MVPYLKPVAITAVLTGIGIAVVGTIIYSRMDSDPVECPAGLFFNKKPPDDLVAKLYVSVDESWFQLNVQPRFMWGWGGSVLGYCGAASLQSAALYYGTWISQEYPRRVAGNDSSPAFLSAAAHPFRLTVEEFDTSAYAYPQADHFLQWTQRHLYRGHVVIGTLYAYVHQIYTDPEFDHLVPIVGLTMTNESLRQYGDYDSWESEGFNYTNATNSSGFNNETNNNNNNTNVYTTNSLITTKVSTNITSVLYNDLSQPEVNEIDHPVAVDRVDYIVPKNKSVPFPFEYAFPDDTNFGLAVIGVMDTFGETYRTKLTPWSWTEPDWGREDGCNEIPALLNISIAVYGLTPGRVYSILRFDGNTSIPKSNFLGSRNYTKRWDFVARSSTYVQSPLDTIMTNTVMSYRTVLSDTQNVNSSFTPSAAAAAAAPLTAAPTRASVRGSLWLDGARAQLKPKEASPPSPQGHNHAAKRVDWGVPLVCIEVLVSVVATLAYVTRRRWRSASSMMDSYEAV